MKKKKIGLVILVLVLLYSIGGIYYNITHRDSVDNSVKSIDKIDKYGYVLKSNATNLQKELFNELKTILNNDNINDDAYAKYSLDTQNTVNELNKAMGVSAGFVNKENGFIKTVRIDYSATEEDFTKYDRLYYPKNEKASTINYELESIGYKCD